MFGQDLEPEFLLRFRVTLVGVGGGPVVPHETGSGVKIAIGLGHPLEIREMLIGPDPE